MLRSYAIIARKLELKAKEREQTFRNSWLTSSWIENKDGIIDWFGRQVTLEGFVNGNSIDIYVIHKPYDLITEYLSVVL